MKCILLLMMGLFMPLALLAGGNDEGMQSAIMFKLQAEGWATTKTARVIVSFHGTMAAKDLDTLQEQVMQKLQKISSEKKWHITVFNRQESSSGLESVFITAETRLRSSELAGLRASAKAVSKPGETYKIETIQFTPGLSDIQHTQANLREEIYKSAKEEMSRLNKLYPNRYYQLAEVNFNEQGPVPMPVMNTLVRSYAGSAESAAVKAGASGMPVSSKIVLTANVTLAVNKNTKGE